MLTNDSPDPSKSIVVLIRGLPGSGKSYLTKELTKSLGKVNTVSLDPDVIDYQSRAYREHVRQSATEGVEPALLPYRFLRAQAYQGIIDRKIVIWNQPFTNLEIFKKMTARFEAKAAEYNTNLSILVVEVAIDLMTAKNRIKERKNAGGHGPSNSTFSRFASEYNSFASQGYNVISVRGKDDISTSVMSVIKSIDSLMHQ